VARASVLGLRTPLAQALAGQPSAIGVVDDAVEDDVSKGRNADQTVPSIYGNLARSRDGDGQRESRSRGHLAILTKQNKRRSAWMRDHWLDDRPPKPCPDTLARFDRLEPISGLRV
jgi:hypothetical protein